MSSRLILRKDQAGAGFAGVEDYRVALPTYRAACEPWHGTPITLWQGARVIEDSRRLRARCRLSLLSATSCSNWFVAPKARRCSIVTLFPLLSGECNTNPQIE